MDICLLVGFSRSPAPCERALCLVPHPLGMLVLALQAAHLPYQQSPQLDRKSQHC